MQKYNGLSEKEARKALSAHGLNVLPEKKTSILRKILAWIVSPVSLMLLAAAALSKVNGSSADFWIILVLFASNLIITTWHEGKADKSIRELQDGLKFSVRTLRDGAWHLIDSSLLVPGDIIELASGGLIPADAEILEGNNLTINESVLTGESLPKEKKTGDTAFSGSFVATGNAVCRIVMTGADTSFGKTVGLVDEAPRRSSLEKDILSISKLVSLVSIAVVFVLTVTLIMSGSDLASILTADLSLMVAGIPVALPTVMSLIISIGVVELSKKKAIVRRLASLEDLSNVDLLLSDKTGTLTENRIAVEKVMAFGQYDEGEVIKLALSAISDDESNSLDNAVREKAIEMDVVPYEQVSMTPGDSERKRSTAIIDAEGSRWAVSLGAPQVIASLADMNSKRREEFDAVVREAAERGYRAHVIAVNKNGTDEKSMELVGLMYIADKLRSDSASTIKFLRENGVQVKMVTGDSYEISRRVADDLGLSGSVCRQDILDKDMELAETSFDSISGFAEVLPKDKYQIVQMARRNHVVAVTGDGVNDLPAVRAADVGFAVSNAVNALKGTADIVLLSDGVSVMKDSIIEARKIFARLYNYSVYRVSESFRLIITIAVIALAYGTFPLTPVQIIILAFLNDIPIVSLAFDRVKRAVQPARIDAKRRFVLSGLLGLTGVANSLILLYICASVFHLSWPIIQTIFFLKLTVSGHMLVYVAHTDERWYKFLPSRQVIWATSITQLIATALALSGAFTAPISFGLVVIVWAWSFVWMQISELAKMLSHRILAPRSRSAPTE